VTRRSGRRVFGALIAAALVAATLGGCTVQHKGPLEAELLWAGDPDGVASSPQAGFRTLRVHVDVRNVGTNKVNAWYTDSNVYLYDWRGNEIRTWTGDTAWAATTRNGAPIDPPTNVLAPTSAINASRDFLVGSEQHAFKVVYRLPGHGDFVWYVW
jgi:hypothetical protein